jgi:hypothetical protein
MGENLGSRFARMSEEERRRFALEQEGDVGDEVWNEDEVAFDDPRSDHARTKADLEDRDGTAAQLDDRRHDEAVRKQARSRPSAPKRETE